MPMPTKSLRLKYMMTERFNGACRASRASRAYRVDKVQGLGRALGRSHQYVRVEGQCSQLAAWYRVLLLRSRLPAVI